MSDLAHIRELYIAYKKAWYGFKHPEAEPDKIAKYARVAWARKIKKYQQGVSK